jgi:hypothetical protein
MDLQLNNRRLLDKTRIPISGISNGRPRLRREIYNPLFLWLK